MRPAPAVALRCTGGRGWRLLRAVLPALAAGAAAAWVLLHLELPAAPAFVVAAAAGAWAWWRARPVPLDLAWDGQHWTADGHAGTLAVMIDAGSGLLLRLRPDAGGPARWAAVSAAEAGPSWHALRAAVYSRPPTTPSRVLPPERAAD